MYPCLYWPEKEKLLEDFKQEKAFFKKENTFDSQKNYLFLQDNLITLKYLYQCNASFDFIYIDPPYDTLHKATSLAYQDNHSLLQEAGWYQFMYPRLLWLHTLLSPKGLLCVSIDDRQQAGLTLLLREVFGIENHIGTIKWKKKKKPSFLNSQLSTCVEYVLLFAKDKTFLPSLRGEMSQDDTRPILNATNKVVSRLLKASMPSLAKDGFYSKGVYQNRSLSVEFLEDFEIKNGKLTKDTPVQGPFRVNQEILEKTAYITPSLGFRRHVLEEEKNFKNPTDMAFDWSTNEDAEQETKFLFSEKLLVYPKPLMLIQKLLQMYPDPQARCLDAFAGTGTTAVAILKNNTEQHENRSFCMIQRKENIISKDYTCMSEIILKRLQHASQTYSSTYTLFTGDL